MKNFNVYDPMKRGRGLTLDGQTLAHLEVTILFSSTYAYLTGRLDPAKQWGNGRRHAFETPWTMCDTIWETTFQDLVMHAVT